MNSKIRSILFSGLLISISIFNMVTPTKAFSSKENRYLQSLPEANKKDIMSGQFATDFEKYTTDQFIGRDLWIGFKTVLDLGILKKDNTRVYFGKDNYLFDVDNEIDEKQMDKNIENINKFLVSLESINKELKITTLLVPTKSQILKEKLPKYGPLVDEDVLLEKIRESLKDNVKIVDLMDILKEKKDEYIYYKTDHHWTTIGAYYGYKKYMEEIDEIPLEQSEFAIENISDDFYGTSYRKANLLFSKPDDIYIYKHKGDVSYEVTYNNELQTDTLYDEAFLGKTDKYSYFLGGDKSLIEIETSVKNGKTIVVLKDSFANSLIPFLVNHYEKIMVIDTRYFNASISEFIKYNDVDEVLFLYNVQNFLQEKTFSKLAL